ncbi:MAG TPA: alpha-L-fucosidase [Phycisphaerae bacterium]|nr:alpha-L-fucosidase [Phycisphaerae bacterium]HNU44938.1 alpha-L-fucosidase [Phycisphaerae bacterium]
MNRTMEYAQSLGLLLAVLAVACGAAAAPAAETQAVAGAPIATQVPATAETPEQFAQRLRWWREARFGMFIHWGLYAIPAGQWGTGTDHGEWIRETAHIPIEEYDRFVAQFNPVRFDANAWVRVAQEAGMRYIVITSKHHDGFCLFDSALTDYDVMSTPFRRDIMKELSDACRRQGLRMCWYHSIMDWHHPDYLPRRSWESRSAEGADFGRYVQHLRGQVEELLTKYGDIGVMWFDGQWEDTWTHEYGQPLYDLCRQLQPNVIINDRVDKGHLARGRAGKGHFAGDYGTPEQMIPSAAILDVPWETCMTLNRHWGYNRLDEDWKSSTELIRMLVDIASKGGNFLLNVGPTAEGEFPPACVERLQAMGAWLAVNGESIYATSAGPFPPQAWGRCTQTAPEGGGTRLYLHVFDWPMDGQLAIGGLFNEARGAYLLADAQRKPLAVARAEDALVVKLPATAPDAVDTVVVLDIAGAPDVTEPPAISAEHMVFVDKLEVTVRPPRENTEIRYTIDGSAPTASSPLVEGPISLTKTTTVRARCFRAGRPVSAPAVAVFTQVALRPASSAEGAQPGLKYEYYEGDWDRLPDFTRLTPVKTGRCPDFDFSQRNQAEHFGFRYSGLVTVPQDGMYRFTVASDDGSRLYIGDTLVVDNDGLHSLQATAGEVPLAAGAHTIRVEFFERTGDDALEVRYAGPGVKDQRIPTAALSSR